MKEICICSAIKLDDGYIIRGHRHDDCIQTISKLRHAGRDVGNPSMDAQGFLTSNNRFVGRKEAYELEIDSGRIVDRPGVKILISEDLY